MPAAGIVLCAAWWGLLKSYRDLNSAKYTVILAMEERLPGRIFADEWAALKGDSVKKERKQSLLKEKFAQYWELGTIERFVPWVFAAIYLIDLIYRARG